MVKKRKGESVINNQKKNYGGEKKEKKEPHRVHFLLLFIDYNFFSDWFFILRIYQNYFLLAASLSQFTYFLYDMICHFWETVSKNPK